MKHSAAVIGISANCGASANAAWTASTCQGHGAHELGLVPAADHQLLAGRAEQATRPADADGRILVTLGVHDEDAGRADHDVVDVRATPRDAAVVQGDDDVTELGHLLAETTLAGGTGRPGPRRLRVVGDREDQPADPRMRRADGGLALIVPAVELRLRGAARLPEIDRRRRCLDHRHGLIENRRCGRVRALQAQDGAGRPIPRGAFARGELGAAPALIRPAERHDLHRGCRSRVVSGHESLPKPAPAVVSST